MSDLAFKPLISRFPGVAKEEIPGLEPANPPNPLPPSELPNELPPKADFVVPPRLPNPPVLVVVEDPGVPAKEVSLLAPAAPNGELPAGLEAARPPKGEEAELEKLPKPDALNLSSEVCGKESTLSDVLVSWDFDGMAANGDTVEVLAKPLDGGI